MPHLRPDPARAELWTGRQGAKFEQCSSGKLRAYTHRSTKSGQNFALNLHFKLTVFRKINYTA